MREQREGESRGIRVRCLTTGAVREKEGERGASRYVLNLWRLETFPVHVFLVEHPAGLLLFDTGQTARAVNPGYLPRWHPFLRLSRFELTPADEAAAQLQREGISADDVRWVVLSHLHNDHVGGLEPLAGAEVLVSRIEWERSVGFRGQLRGYVPQHWPTGLVPRLLDLDGPSIGPFRGSHDVAGDGRLLVVPTPGHTPGHLALIARGPPSFLLAGDVAHSWAELEDDNPAIAAWCRKGSVTFLATHDESAAELLSDSG